MLLMLSSSNKAFGIRNSLFTEVMKLLRLAVSFLFFHSIISVMVLYSYVLWAVKDNDDRSEQLDEQWMLEKPLVWPDVVSKNGLSNDVLRPDRIGIRGWWMAHDRWTTDVECFNEYWGTCIKVFSIPCRVDSVRSIYQWVPLRSNSGVKGIQLTLRSTAEELRREASDAFYGALALIKLSDQSVQTKQIKFSEDSVYNLLKKAVFYSPSNLTIDSVTIMLCCYGFVGITKFMDLSLMLLQGQNEYMDASSVIASCPRVASHPTTSFKTEFLNTSRQGSNYLHQVTLVTQVSMDRLGILERSLSSWEGPISLAIFIPFKLQKSQDDTDWQRMYTLKKLHRFSNVPLLVTLVYGKSYIDEYPINYLRNIAIRQATTEFIFLVDADFTPAPEFQSKFDVVTRAYRQTADKTAWVVPAFEFLEPPGLEEATPKTKEDLVEQVLAENSNIQPFRLGESPESHRLTDYWQWYRAEHPYQIYGYNDKYEPYVVLKKTPEMPTYSEQFTGYGMNKVSHVTELYAAGYKFRVLHDLWAIHVPHRTTTYTISFLQSPIRRLQNRAIRYEFLGQIMRTYKLGSCGLVGEKS